jgi:hypothetical protein
MPEAVVFTPAAVVELEGAVTGGAAEVEVEDKEGADEPEVGREHAAQTNANNPTARPTEMGPFATVIEDRRPLRKPHLGIRG